MRELARYGELPWVGKSMQRSEWSRRRVTVSLDYGNGDGDAERDRRQSRLELHLPNDACSVTAVVGVGRSCPSKFQLIKCCGQLVRTKLVLSVLFRYGLSLPDLV